MLALVFLLFCVACGGDSGGSSPASSTSTGGDEPQQPTQTREAGEEPAPGGGGRRSAEVGPVEVERSVIATDLEVPWGFAFLPNGDALFTERDSGDLLRMDGSGKVEEVQTLPTRGYGEGGSLGLAVSPEYERDGYLYAYYTTGGDNRVVRFRLGEEPEPILTGIPFNSYHDGGRISFGPDGMLYVATGDAGDPSNSQDRGSLGGKILRIEPDGGVPEDNPFPGSPVYSYGHRNIEGLTWDERDRLYASEFGQDAFDEVNLIRPGANYGWPEFEGDGGEEAEVAGYVNPVTTWSTSEASPSGAEILKNGAIPQWDGDLFVAALRGQRLWRLELGPDGRVTHREELLRDEVGRIRNVVQAPDGSLWVTTSNLDGYGSPVSEEDDRILRLAPEGE
ncbi:MAG TPA: PQQ-dependent sugar dehydrogenase [Rubrobacteraceae bacterium]|nr:PQQ-dependent sugar dehydrogenase [Rubrobacteraceae bacterium]